MSENTLKLVRFVFFLATLCLCTLVWAMRYRYDRATFYGDRSMPVRTNRFTDRTEVLDVGGWEELNNDPPVYSDLPSEQLSGLQGGNGLLDSSGKLTCNFYNGTPWTIRLIRITVTVRSAQDTVVLSRDYQLVTATGGEPMTSTKFTADLGFTVAAGQTWAWTVIGAKRIK